MIRNRWLAIAVLLCLIVAPVARAADAVGSEDEKVPNIAAVVTVYHHNSHADVIVSRLLQTTSLDGKGSRPKLKLVSLFADQVPKNDMSRRLAEEHKFKLCDNVADALTLGTGKLAVDGVLLIAEHGNYPLSDTGQKKFPKRRLFGEIVKVFESSGRVVPVYSDKHLADNWKDAKWFYDNAQRLKIPLMAGSSLPTAWRYPPVDIKKGEPIKELFALTYGGLEAYGFHALEMVQSLVERRKGGETGIKSVQCLEGDAVWEAGRRGVFDQELLDAAVSRLKVRRVPDGKKLQDVVRRPPVLFSINYDDGLRVNVLSPGSPVQEWTAAWRYAKDDRIESTLFWLQDGRPYGHFTPLLAGIEKMMHTGQPTWPADRTLLVTGTLNALMISKRDGNRELPTPHLARSYTVPWNWQQPPPPPPTRPSRGQ